MTDEEIFDLAETHGWQDDFGRWNFKDDGLISFALEVLRLNAEQQEPACWINGKELAGMRASATHWGASEWKTNLGLKPMPDDVPLYTAPVMSEKNVRVSDKNRLIRIMGTFDLATGHADTMDQAMDALESELRDVLGYLRAKREWVGLTDDEVFNIYKQFDSLQYKSFAKAIEAKLKELNV